VNRISEPDGTGREVLAPIGLLLLGGVVGAGGGGDDGSGIVGSDLSEDLDDAGEELVERVGAVGAPLIDLRLQLRGQHPRRHPTKDSPLCC